MELSVNETESQAAVRTPAPPLDAVRIQHTAAMERTSLLQNRQSAPIRRNWIPLALLALITLIGGIFRFYRLTYPALWNDECLVYWRVCGTYGQMLRPLSLDGFPPLHYSLYWLIGHYHTLTPFVMRLVPAICGTLTIPAIYFLARQMLAKRTSLLAAALTACSAFMLFYSRDAKMYPDVWLFITLNVACMLWWFRTSFSTAYLCWIAAGCAMVGLHASAFAIPVISVLMFFTQRRLTWQKSLLFVLGMIVIASGPVIYATKFNHWTERVEEVGWETSGIGWVNGFFNGNRTGPDHVLYTTSAFLTGYEWPRDDYLEPKYNQPIAEPLREIPQTAFQEVIWILAIGIFPWSFFLRRRSNSVTPVLRYAEEPGRLPVQSAFLNSSTQSSSPEPAWRSYFWLGSWILVCGYGAYCYSVRDFESPRRWTYELLQALGVQGLAIFAAILAAFTLVAIIHRQYRPGWIHFVQFLAVTAALYGICYVMFVIAWPEAARAQFSDDPWQSVWTPRYLGFIWPAFGIACAALLMRLPTRPVRIACIIFVLAVNLGAAAMRFTIGTEPPIQQMANDIWRSQDPKSTVRAFDFVTVGDIAYAGTAIHPNPKMATGRYYLQMESNRQPISPDIFSRSPFDTYKLRNNPDFTWFKRNIDSAPKLKDVIIWTVLYPPQYDGRPHELTFDPYGKILGAKWKLVSEEVSVVHNYWDWRERWKWVRREYQRNAE
jgi:4-amino-4-deoxy-L-arabinose transferase-like glycosyltransferase